MSKVLMLKLMIYFLGVSLSCLIAFLWHSNSLKVDYSKLEFLLSQGKWIESDLYTEELVDRLLSKAVDDSRFFGFSRLDFFRLQRTNILHSGRLPCEDRAISFYTNSVIGYRLGMSLI
jgi:hypothetical protein